MRYNEARTGRTQISIFRLTFLCYSAGSVPFLGRKTLNSSKRDLPASTHPASSPSHRSGIQSQRADHHRVRRRHVRSPPNRTSRYPPCRLYLDPYWIVKDCSDHKSSQVKWSRTTSYKTSSESYEFKRDEWKERNEMVTFCQRKYQDGPNRSGTVPMIAQNGSKTPFITPFRSGPKRSSGGALGLAWISAESRRGPLLIGFLFCQYFERVLDALENRLARPAG